MCCLALLVGFLGPRVGLLAVWIFGDRVELAFDGWIWPLLGLFFLPWTTLFYVLSWSALSGTTGWDYVFIGFGVLLDVMTYSSRAARGRYESRTSY